MKIQTYKNKGQLKHSRKCDASFGQNDPDCARCIERRKERADNEKNKEIKK